MPELARITATFFTTLLTRLGVRPPFAEGYLLSNVIQPVSLVDSDVSLSASVTTQVLTGANTAGELTNPAGGTVLADSGAQAVAGTYRVFFMAGVSGGAANADIRIGRRNAANGADIWLQISSIGPNVGPIINAFSTRLEASERVRILSGGNSVGVGQTIQANLWIEGPV